MIKLVTANRNRNVWSSLIILDFWLIIENLSFTCSGRAVRSTMHPVGTVRHGRSGGLRSSASAGLPRHRRLRRLLLSRQPDVVHQRFRGLGARDQTQRRRRRQDCARWHKNWPPRVLPNTETIESSQSITNQRRAGSRPLQETQTFDLLRMLRLHTKGTEECFWTVRSGRLWNPTEKAGKTQFLTEVFMYW